jgi:hypothetical protein
MAASIHHTKRDGAEQGFGSAALVYKSQRAFVSAMFQLLGRLLVAGSAVDPAIARELVGFPEGYTIGFSVLGETLSLRLAHVGGRLVPVDERHGHAQLEIVFKHVAHAFALLSFQESTSTAFAHDRFVSHGDVGLSMRFMRCLDRVQGVVLPDPLAARALKSLPNIPPGERLRLVTRIAGALVRGFFPAAASRSAQP